MSVSAASINYNNKLEGCVIMFNYIYLKVEGIYFSIRTKLILLFFFLIFFSIVLRFWGPGNAWL